MMMLRTTPLVVLLACFSVTGAQTTFSNMMLNTGDFKLGGGATFVNGHGAPTGMALRTGSPGEQSTAAFPKKVLAPGCKVTSVSMTFRYIVGFEKVPSGQGSNLSLSISGVPSDGLVYQSPHFTEYAYSHDNSNYSEPIVARWTGSVAVAAADGATSRLQLDFDNNDRNLQLLIPLSVNVTCEGVAECFVAPPAPKPGPPTPPPPPPAPPSPPPPKTNTPWKMIGPWNIGDDIHAGGEAGTIAPAVSVIGNPNLMYMGGNNNAASSGVLKSVNYGKNWTKMNVGLFDTRIFGLFIVDDKGDHVLAGTLSGVFETLDGAATWTHVTQVASWGSVNSFRNGTINGKSVIFVGANAGLGNVPLLKNSPLVKETWNLILSPPGSSAWRTQPVSVADFDGQGKPLMNSKLAGCLWINGNGKLHLLTVINETAADWTVFPDEKCQSIALDPNNADHILVNNASNGAHVYESNDGGKTYHGCLDRSGAVMIAVDRKGWFYTGSEAGLFRNRNGCGNNSEWELLFVRRQWRRMNHTVDRAAHDYQRINIDFAGGMAFGSDQGMFVMNGTELQMYSACGDLNNNVIMHPAIAEAETPGETCIVTALWDWSPVASWDSGKHWPSWQTPDDGTSMGYFGEGGGCFGVGQSKHVLCMHHHDVGYSSRCGKNMSRLIIPNGASAAGPTFERKQGSRSEPNGMIYALMSMGTPQFQTLTDKAVTCDGVNGRGDLGVSTSYQCLSMIDIGMVYNWYSGANVAVWRGDTDKHCHLCKLSGSQPSWNMTDTKGAIVFAFDKDAKVQKPRFNKVKEDNNGEYSYDGKGSDDHRAMYKFNKHVAKEARLEMGQEEEAPPFSTDLVPLGGNPFWLLKSFNFGANFTWILLPEFLQTLSKTSVDPTNSSILYGIAGSCIGRSYDGAETWGDEKCWQATGLVGHFTDLVIKDSQTMLAMRSGQVPLRTVDGGNTWTPLNSLSAIAARTLHAAFSWSGKTLAVSTVIDQTVIWISTDDGDTWVDESGDYSAMSGGIAQWYNSTLYICSMGQGISSKVFEEKP